MPDIYKTPTKLLKGLLLFFIFLLLNLNAFGQTTHVVTSTADTGPGSLREAIELANASSTRDIIHFSIAGTGPHTIQLLSSLPSIIQPVALDATTQAGYSPETPQVVIDGNGTIFRGLSLEEQASGSIIKGFVFGGFNTPEGSAIYAEVSGGHTIQGNFIGIAANGQAPFANWYGIVLKNSANNLIGGTVPEERNLISGNSINAESGVGVNIYGPDSHNNKVIGNLIGTNLEGTAAVANYIGVAIHEASHHNIIGAPSEQSRNILSGNDRIGIYISGTDNVVQGNYIGLSKYGEMLSNYEGVGQEGVRIWGEAGVRNKIGGSESGEGNVISGNTNFNAITVGQSNNSNIISGNYIGTNPDGTRAMPNYRGVTISGSSTVITQNLISGNLTFGLQLHKSDNNEIYGNLIGTQADGNSPLPNCEEGLIIINGSQNNKVGDLSPGQGNTIAYNKRSGIVSGIMYNVGSKYLIDPLNNRISGNRIFGNGQLGIDLSLNGFSANDRNDADSGPNSMQNFPVLSSDATYDGTNLKVSYYVPSSSSYSTYPIQVEIFIDDGKGQGKVFIGSDVFTETDFKSKGGKPKPITITGATLTAGEKILATATDANGNTSEFGVAVEVQVTGGCTTPTTYYADADGDGFGVDNVDANIVSCENPGEGYSTRAGDCNDNDLTVYPGAVEIPGDGIDQDCDGVDASDECLGTDILNITEGCTDPSVNKIYWSITNPAACAVTVRWEVQKASGGGPVTVPAGGTVEISTSVASKGPTKVTFYWIGSNGTETSTTLFSSGNLCSTSTARKSSQDISDEAKDNPLFFKAYPNPVTAGGLWLEFPAYENETNIEAIIYDLSGRVMADKNFEIGNEGSRYLWQVDHADWAAGVYILRISGDTLSQQVKIIK